MKILHVIKGIPKSAGTTVFCGEVLNHSVQLGIDCRLLVCERTPDVYSIDTGVPVFYEEMSRLLADGWQPDVVHIHGLWTPLLHRVNVWARDNRRRIVLSPHGMLAPWAMAHKRWKKLLPWYLYQRSDIIHATMIHSTSEQESKWVRNLGFTNPIIEVPLGTHLPSQTASYVNPVKTLLFVGRIYPVKGLDLLISAWGKIKTVAREMGWRVMLVGPDQAGYMQTLERMCETEDLKIGEDVVFMGPLYGVDKDRAYMDARALILPSYSENFGGVVVDAMSFGLPVLTSEATPWNFLQEKGCGFHFPLNVDALVQTLQRMMGLSDMERLKMGQLGRRFVEEKYSWGKVAEQLLRSYATVLNS